MQLFFQRLIDGIQNGAVYSVVAIPMVLIFKATTLINFAQGELAMFGAFLAFVFAVQVLSVPLWVAAIMAMALSAVLGMGVERVLLRRYEPSDQLPVVLTTLGLFYVVNAVAGDIWNYQPNVLPSFFPSSFKDVWVIGGVRIFHDSVGIMASLLVMLAVLYVILNKTKMGLAFRAVSSDSDSSRLVGIRVGRTLSFGWGLACAFGALGAILVAPRITLQPNMMAPVLVYALAAAAVGGLDSVGGAAVGGVIVGLLNSVVLGYVSDLGPLSSLSAAPLLPPILLLVAVLSFRPAGLFGTKQIERV